MRTPMSYLILAAAMVCGAAPLAAQRTGESFSWQGTLRPGQVIAIRGISGQITATPAAGAEASVTAQKHARRSNPAEVQIKAVPSADGITICALYPPQSGDPANECLPGGRGHNSSRNNDTQVDFTIHVPAGVRFVASNVNGGIEATGLTGDVDARTVNGGIHLATEGLARAQTVNGGIDAQMGRTDWSGTINLETVNGGIRVTLPASASTSITAETVNGGLSSDFPLTVQGRFNPHRITGVLGQGGRDLLLKTVNGGIDLRRR